ncbi:hypothetical protein EJ07DRAFT_154158 [Lizonia empirigonia]|nr:hypothetical protein EJ07DRAFT_154158 [Lizonia empirigonia]
MPLGSHDPASDRAKSMLLASVGFSNPRDGVVVEAGRSSRGQQSLAKKPPKTLAQRPFRRNSMQIRIRRARARVHLQPAVNRSFASAPLTVAPNARSCATCANFASSRPTLLTAADLLNALLPALWSSSACGAQIPSSLAHSGAPRVRSPRREGACSISPESGGCPVINSLALVLTVACSGTRTLTIARLDRTIGQDSRQGLTKTATADRRLVHQHRVKGELPRYDSLANPPWRLSQRDKGNADPRLLKHVVCLRLGPAITHPCTHPQPANAHCLQAVGVPTCCNKQWDARGQHGAA